MWPPCPKDQSLASQNRKLDSVLVKDLVSFLNEEGAEEMCPLKMKLGPMDEDALPLVALQGRAGKEGATPLGVL